MSREVTLYTKSGWKRTVQLDDPTFSQILAPLIELGDEATELELSGAVGEAFEREWDALKRLGKRWRNLKSNAHGFYQSIDENPQLHEIRILPGLLELPIDSPLVVSVLSTDPQYKQHIALQAALYRAKMAKEGKSASAPMYVSTRESTLYGAWGLEPMRGNPYLAALIVNRHATREKLDTVANVDWELAVELNPDTTPQERVVLMSLAGKGSYADEWKWRNLTANAMVRLGIKGGLHRLNIAYHYPVAELYRYAIRLFPQDVDPHKFGLSYLLNPSLIKKNYISGPGKLGKYAVPNDLANVAVWVHMNMAMIAYRNNPPDIEGTFVDYAMSHIIGKAGLARILISLLHAGGERADELATVIESKIGQEVELSDEFPPYH